MNGQSGQAAAHLWVTNIRHALDREFERLVGPSKHVRDGSDANGVGNEAAKADLLVDLWRGDADKWAGRAELAETRAAAIATVALGFGTLIVTQSARLAVAQTRATIAFALFAVAVGLSLGARVAPRMRPVCGWRRARPSVLTLSPQLGKAWHDFLEGSRSPTHVDADAAMEGLTPPRGWGQAAAAGSVAPQVEGEDPVGLLGVRRALAEYWCLRARSNKRSYTVKARWVTAAATALMLAIVMLGVAGVTLLANP